MDESWQEKKGFSSMISNKYIDKLYAVAKKNGALGGKITGAGGGGHMLFYCQPNTEHKVRKVLSEKGCIPVPFSFDFQGMQSWDVKG
jgi:D-glycero-alpha-D-manno-heptose-7-phosphate kinase